MMPDRTRIDIQNLQSICRLCLRANADILVDVFKEKPKVVEKIKLCCKLEMYENDGLPKNICMSCIETLDVAHEFIKLCEDSDFILKRELFKTENVKQEFDMDIKDEPLPKDDDNESEDCSLFALKKSKPTRIKKKRKRNPKITEMLEPSPEIKMEDDKELAVMGGLCPFCGKFFEKKTSFNSHVKRHTLSEVFTCSQCAKSFKENGKLREHEKIHLQIRNCPCDICGKLFNSKCAARKHKVHVHERLKTTRCKICNKELANQASLKCHMKIHTGEREFACDICHRKFGFKCSLLVHLRCHTGEKPYACKFCDAKFAALKTFREHERLHTGENPYSCPVCSKGFKQKSNMKSHFRNNHKNHDISICSKRIQTVN